MSLSTVKLEEVGYLISNIRDQLNKATSELETTKKLASQAAHENTILRHNIEALNVRVMQGEEYKKRWEQTYDLMEQVVNKKKHAEATYLLFLRMCTERGTEILKWKTESERHKNGKEYFEKVAKQNRRHIPNMLKLIDDLALEAGHILSLNIKRRIEHFAKQDLRRQLLETSNSDDEMADQVEKIVTGAVRVPKTTRAVTVDVRLSKEKGRGQKRYSLEETEKLYKQRLDNKLSNNNSQPLSEVIGGHRTIHGIKGPTVRQQQIEMLNVKERVARMKENEVIKEEHPEAERFPSPERKKWRFEDDFELSPSPLRSLSPIGGPKPFENELEVDIPGEHEVVPSPSPSDPGFEKKATRPPTEDSCPLAQIPPPTVTINDKLSTKIIPTEKMQTDGPYNGGWNAEEIKSALQSAKNPAQELCQRLASIIRILKISKEPQTVRGSIFDVSAQPVNIDVESVASTENLSKRVVENALVRLLAKKAVGIDVFSEIRTVLVGCIERACTIMNFLQRQDAMTESSTKLQDSLTTFLRAFQRFTQFTFPVYNL